MRATALGILVAAAAALTGCAGLSRPRPVAYAPIVQQADNSSWPIEQWEKEAAAERKPAPKDAPRIRIDAQFLAAKPDLLKELGVRLDEPARVASASLRQALLAEVKAKARAQVLFLPHLRVAAGQRADVSVKTGHEYAGEWNAAPPGEPVLMTVDGGVLLDVNAAIEGADVVFTRIDPRVVAVLGMRACTATVAVGGRESEIYWQEPALLVACGSVPVPCRIRLSPGESVLVPLRHSVLLGRSKARELVKAGKMRETYGKGTEDLRRPNPRGYPLRNHVVVLITPRIADASDGRPAGP